MVLLTYMYSTYYILTSMVSMQYMWAWKMGSWNELNRAPLIFSPSYEVHGSMGFDNFLAGLHCYLAAWKLPKMQNLSKRQFQWNTEAKKNLRQEIKSMNIHPLLAHLMKFTTAWTSVISYLGLMSKWRLKNWRKCYISSFSAILK